MIRCTTAAWPWLRSGTDLRGRRVRLAFPDVRVLSHPGLAMALRLAPVAAGAAHHREPGPAARLLAGRVRHGLVGAHEAGGPGGAPGAADAEAAVGEAAVGEGAFR